MKDKARGIQAQINVCEEPAISCPVQSLCRLLDWASRLLVLRHHGTCAGAVPQVQSLFASNMTTNGLAQARLALLVPSIRVDSHLPRIGNAAQGAGA
jgi:hypothetical protein